MFSIISILKDSCVIPESTELALEDSTPTGDE
jgi:hypothetical protein